MITPAHSEDRGRDYMNESRQRENKIISCPWRGVNYRFYCCVFFLYQLQKNIYYWFINFLCYCQNYITPNELLQQKENQMGLTYFEMYRKIILHSYPFSNPKIYHAKSVLIVKCKQMTELMLQEYTVRDLTVVWFENNKF